MLRRHQLIRQIMKIDISQKDLQSLRRLVYEQCCKLENSPNPDCSKVDVYKGRKFIQKMNMALKKVYGHDCMGHFYLHHTRDVKRGNRTHPPT